MRGGGIPGKSRLRVGSSGAGQRVGVPPSGRRRRPLQLVLGASRIYGAVAGYQAGGLRELWKDASLRLPERVAAQGEVRS